MKAWKKGGKSSKAFGLIASALMVAMAFGAFANTGCVYPWEKFDNMIVTASIGVDDAGEFSIDGAVTSASVKALGYVSSADALAASYSACSEMSKDANIDPSWYDSVRYDSTARREADYARVSGGYSEYFTREHWYSLSYQGVSSVDRTNFNAAAAAVAGVEAEDFGGDNGITPTGQSGNDVTFIPDWTKTYDLNGLTSLFGAGGGDISNMSGDFGMQSFNWKLNKFHGKGWGVEGGTKLWFAPKDIATYLSAKTDLSENDTALLAQAQAAGSGVEMTLTRTYVDLTDNRTKSEVLPDDCFKYSNVYYRVNTDYTVDYYLFLLTDATRFLTQIGDSLKIDYAVTMYGMTFTSWQSSCKNLETYSSSLSDSVEEYITSQWNQLAWNFTDLTAKTSGAFSSAIGSALGSTVGNLNVPPTLDILTLGGASDQQQRIEAYSENIGMFDRYQKIVYIVQKTVENPSKFADLDGVLNGRLVNVGPFKIPIGGIKFTWKDTNYYGATTTMHDVKITSSDTDAYALAERILRIKTQMKEIDSHGWFGERNGFYPDVITSFQTSDIVDSTDGDLQLSAWITWVSTMLETMYKSAIITPFKPPAAPSISLFDEGIEVVSCSGTATQARVMSVFEKKWQLIWAQSNSQFVDLNLRYNETLANMSAQYMALYEQFNLTVGNLTNMVNKLTLDLDTVKNQSKFFYEQWNITQQKMNDLVAVLNTYGFQTAYDEGNGVWVMNVNWEEFTSKFNIIESVACAPPSYAFNENFVNGKLYVPVSLSTSNAAMRDDTFITLEADKLGDSYGYEVLAVENCSASKTYYNIPIELDGIGLYNIRAIVNFTNGTATPADDVIFETEALPGFGQVRVVGISLDNMLNANTLDASSIFRSVNDTRMLTVRIKLFDGNDGDKELPLLSYVGGQSRIASFGIGRTTNVKWTVNYIRSHTFTGTVEILDDDGKVIAEEAIPEFTFKNAAFAEGGRSSDTLALSDFTEGSEYAKFGDWE